MTTSRQFERHPGHNPTHEVYRLSCAEYAALLWRAEGRCERCETPCPALTIDHEHGHVLGWRAVRGFLCRRCNALLAQADQTGSGDKATLRYLANPFHASIPALRPTVDGREPRQRESEGRRTGGSTGLIAIHVRAPRDVLDAFRGEAASAGWRQVDVLLACLDALRRRPNELLAFLAPYRQPAKPRGRPRKAGRSDG